MIIRKIFNNNTVLVDGDGEEMIVTGLGIGYNFKVGEEVDTSLIEKKYVLNNNEKQRYLSIFSGEKSFYEIACEIFEIAKDKLKMDLYDQSILELADHISFLVERLKNNDCITFAIGDEMMSIYPDEYEIAMIGCRLIEKTYKIELPDDEAGFIAFHIVSAEKESGNKSPLKLMHFVSSVIDIIKNNYPNINKENNSFSYSRMIMHLRFLGNRILSKERLKGSEVTQLMKIYSLDKKLQETINEIDEFILNNYDWDISDEEKTYIMIHIKRFN